MSSLLFHVLTVYNHLEIVLSSSKSSLIIKYHIHNTSRIINKSYTPYINTRRYGGLQAPTSSSCGGLVAFGHLGGPSGPLDTCKKNHIFFIGPPPPPAAVPPTPCTEFFYPHFFLPPFFYRAPPPYTPLPPPPLHLAQSFFCVAILDFEVNVKLFEVDVKNVTERNGGDQARFFYVDNKWHFL